MVAPRLGPTRMVPGLPKRFAQSIGLVLTGVAALAAAGGAITATAVLLGVLPVFALLESVAGFCAGCWLFGLLMRWGRVSEDTCADCQDLGARYGRQPAGRP